MPEYRTAQVPLPQSESRVFAGQLGWLRNRSVDDRRGLRADDFEIAQQFGAIVGIEGVVVTSNLLSTIREYEAVAVQDRARAGVFDFLDGEFESFDAE
jgi:hypothetical protein